jgi:hypothetical protein
VRAPVEIGAPRPSVPVAVDACCRRYAGGRDVGGEGTGDGTLQSEYGVFHPVRDEMDGVDDND